MGLPALLDSYIVRINVGDDRVGIVSVPGIDEALEVIRDAEGEPPLGDSHAGRGGRPRSWGKERRRGGLLGKVVRGAGAVRGVAGVVRATRKPQMRVGVLMPLVEAEVGAEGGLVGQWDAWIGGVPSPPAVDVRMPQPLMFSWRRWRWVGYPVPAPDERCCPTGFDAFVRVISPGGMSVWDGLTSTVSDSDCS
jgi:hypothetical protein